MTGPLVPENATQKAVAELCRNERGLPALGATKGKDPIMDKSIYQARWILGPLFCLCFGIFVGIGMIGG
ncbi:hypothetical protein GCM10011385_40880 [Nitratireductor aestuarii]|uniref:Uncharacterized protein n=1 Tax=Nitratireductor aestuarii TaxID=1735103 RepID=A0A916S435_9HYPH|nr:hypothetical protein GCM10011385_40880 [Nitratireductor aestuarii]